MRKIIFMLLLLSLASFITNAHAELNVQPQYVLDQAPFLNGKNVMYLNWYTGDISDSQNFEKNLLKNFALNLNRLGVPKDTIPEIISNISSIAAVSGLTEEGFNPDKDKFKAEISYNVLRLKDMGGDVQIITLPWQDVEEISLGTPEVKLLTNECGTTDGIRAIRFVPARDMSNLISIDNVSVQVINALNNGNSLVVQNVMVNPEIRNAVAIVKNNINANKSSGLRYMVVGNNQESVNCVLLKISEAGGGSSPTQESSPLIFSQSTSSPIAPVPELSPVILIMVGLLGILFITRMHK